MQDHEFNESVTLTRFIPDDADRISALIALRMQPDTSSENTHGRYINFLLFQEYARNPKSFDNALGRIAPEQQEFIILQIAELLGGDILPTRESLRNRVFVNACSFGPEVTAR